MELLIKMGYNEKYTSDDYILCTDRDLSVKSLMDLLSKIIFTFLEEQVN